MEKNSICIFGITEEQERIIQDLVKSWKELEADKKENATKQGQHLHEEFPCLRELEFQYHTLSASLVPYKEEHYRLVDLDCASVLRLICKNLSSLQAHEVHPWIAYLVGVFEGSAMQRQQKIGQQSGNSI